MDTRTGTRATRRREAREVHPLWQPLVAIDAWISGKMRGLWQWLSKRSTAVLKLIWVPTCLVFGPLAALLSPVLMVMSGLACLLSLLIMLSRYFRGQPLRTWAIVAALSFTLAVGPFHEMSVILYSPEGGVDLLGLNPDVQEYCRDAAGTAETDSMCDPPWKKLLDPYTSVIDEVLG